MGGLLTFPSKIIEEFCNTNISDRATSTTRSSSNDGGFSYVVVRDGLLISNKHALIMDSRSNMNERIARGDGTTSCQGIDDGGMAASTAIGDSTVPSWNMIVLSLTMSSFIPVTALCYMCYRRWNRMLHQFEQEQRSLLLDAQKEQRYYLENELMVPISKLLAQKRLSMYQRREIESIVKRSVQQTMKKQQQVFTTNRAPQRAKNHLDDKREADESEGRDEGTKHEEADTDVSSIQSCRRQLFDDASEQTMVMSSLSPATKPCTTNFLSSVERPSTPPRTIRRHLYSSPKLTSTAATKNMFVCEFSSPSSDTTILPCAARTSVTTMTPSPFSRYLSSLHNAPTSEQFKSPKKLAPTEGESILRDSHPVPSSIHLNLTLEHKQRQGQDHSTKVDERDDNGKKDNSHRKCCRQGNNVIDSAHHKKPAQQKVGSPFKLYVSPDRMENTGTGNINDVASPRISQGDMQQWKKSLRR